ncbi:HAD-IB family phosphatase [Botrimarina sp.]|uniref:HAD-IB family phosphatase n=1 Tax=Botrimarina sp. TaxID=2795802 RepID=UPI0032EBE784
MDHSKAFQESLAAQSVLVSDFDGTLAHPDFYQLIRARLVPEDTPDYWSEYRAGQLSHFDALRQYFEAAEGGEAALLAVLDAITLPGDLPGLVDELASAGWGVLIVSSGCQWYIDRLLERAGARLPVITNIGRIEHGRLTMRRPELSPFGCEENGVDKRLVVQRLLDEGKTVAYCGDGFTDLTAARLVGESRRFARADLAGALGEHKLGFRPFSTWGDVVRGLLLGEA